jgi:hypothetical protein
MTDHEQLMEVVAENLTQSISHLLTEMGLEEGQRFAKAALIEFATQALGGAPHSGGMNLSSFTEDERKAVAQASALVLATIEADASLVQ